MDTEKSPEVWDQLTNESGRAYEAFKVYMFMSPAERSVVGAWREWTENPEAARPSPFFEGWSREHAWSERARAHDAHIERIRCRGMERAIEAEAERQAREVEMTRYRYNELMTYGYERAMEWLENSESSDLRPQDVIQIIRLHMDAIKTFEATETPRNEVTWTEEEEAELIQIIGEIEAEEGEEEPEEGSEEGEDSDQSEDELN
jgi:hypothetical protein